MCFFLVVNQYQEAATKSKKMMLRTCHVQLGIFSRPGHASKKSWHPDQCYKDLSGGKSCKDMIP